MRLAALLHAMLIAASIQASPSRVTVDVNYGPPPATWEALWEGTPLILRGVVVTSRVRVAVAGKRNSIIVTEHALRVSEILKQEASNLPDVLPVLQVGGTQKVNDSLIVTDLDGMRVYGRGDELLLFLKPWPQAEGYGIVHGQVGAYLLNHTMVELPNRARHFAPSFGNRTNVPREEFLAVVRSMRSRELSPVRRQ